ncbi:hypothetical protein [Thiosulfativibrio zosterae]|uniref:Uncharacterized protein n=1 Tax=Thiosulfativibrio zosterae TaxID=2675053 RepID=A0A6F8PK63_9GAMM|nr:hypothetical protein [Thiosulfativibrio zosterae]BBP42489.1 hypothetical protein THMIRHAT_02350 [Thiosulfativibrio zosterae]
MQLKQGLMILLVSMTAVAQADSDKTPFPMQPSFWTDQMRQGGGDNSIKDRFNYNAKAWNDWIGNGNTRYRFYGNMDLEMQMDWLAKMQADQAARQQQSRQASANMARGQGFNGQQGYYGQPYYGQPNFQPYTAQPNVAQTYPAPNYGPAYPMPYPAPYQPMPMMPPQAPNQMMPR